MDSCTLLQPATSGDDGGASSPSAIAPIFLDKGTHNNYFWFQTFDTNLTMAKFCDTFRHYLLNNYVCVTAFDSGNLYLSDEDIKLGWQNIDNVATSPKIKADTELPSAGFDEWYIFTKRPATLKLADVYVNYSSFHLEDSSELLRKFWHDIEINQPNIYVADGDGLKIVTTDEALKQEIETSWC